MDNYDDDFSTLKPNTIKLNKPLSAWKPDVYVQDADATIKSKPQIKESPSDFDVDLESDDDFADEFESAMKHGPRTPNSKQVLPDAFNSDSSTKSPGRASLSSFSSASIDRDDEFENDFEDVQVLDSRQDLVSRFKARQQRAQLEELQEQETMKFFSPKFKNDERDDMDDLDLDQLTLRVKNGTVNKNVRVNPIGHIPPNLHTSKSSKMLRGMRSIAQFPQQREDPIKTRRIRGAMSMMNLGDVNTLKPEQMSKQRPLTAYKEPKTVRKQKSRPLNLIRNPLNSLTRQEKHGMVLNPHTGMWEGNEQDFSRFEEPAKPKLITKHSLEPLKKEITPSGMLFDSRTLSWVYQNEADYEDPFADIDNENDVVLPSPASSPTKSARKVRIDSLASSSSSASTSTASSQYGRASVVRSETSGEEVFALSSRTIAEWTHADQRFMRKFGKWIGGPEERADTLMSDQHFYEMVRHA